MLVKLKVLWELLKETYEEWSNDNALRLGAALSYYMIFSLPPVLLIVIALAGFIFGEDAARGRIVEEIQGLIGRSGAEGVETMIRNAYKPEAGIIATIVGVVTLIVASTGVFAELQDALNTVWNVKPAEGRGIMDILRVRMFSFIMIVGIGFLLLVSLVLSAGISALNDYVLQYQAELLSKSLLQVINIVISLAISTGLFAMIYKLLPDVRIAWKDVWLGAFFTSLLFTIGKFAIGLYLGNSDVGSSYGAAGSMAIILFWVYYSSQILFFGAEFTQVYSRRFGRAATPIRGAVRFREVLQKETSSGSGKMGVMEEK
jgi:membrane protein